MLLSCVFGVHGSLWPADGREVVTCVAVLVGRTASYRLKAAHAYTDQYVAGVYVGKACMFPMPLTSSVWYAILLGIATYRLL